MQKQTTPTGIRRTSYNWVQKIHTVRGVGVGVVTGSGRRRTTTVCVPNRGREVPCVKIPHKVLVGQKKSFKS